MPEPTPRPTAEPAPVKLPTKIANRDRDLPNVNRQPQQQQQPRSPPSSVSSLSSLTPSNDSKKSSRVVHLRDAQTLLDPEKVKQIKLDFASMAEEIYLHRTNNAANNRFAIRKVFDANYSAMANLLARCPYFEIILAHALILRLGFRAQEVDWTSDMKDWGAMDCTRVGKSVATLMRYVQKGDACVDSWRIHYPQLNILFDEVVGFEESMTVICNNLIRDNKFGMFFRVSVGALLSTIDAGE